MFNPRVHDLILTDNTMPGMTGEEMSHVIKMRSPSTLVVMVTVDAPLERSCLDLVLLRPVHLMRLKEALDELLVASNNDADRPVSP